jgi:Flp pilus assembly protein TadD
MERGWDVCLGSRSLHCRRKTCCASWLPYRTSPAGLNTETAQKENRPARHSLHLAAAILLAHAVAAQDAGKSAATLFEQGRTRFEAGAYDEAVVLLERAVALEPDDSNLHLWLGRSYGRSAERSNWLRAVRLARRTLREFRNAAELDPENHAAWSDLAEYYRRAPAFLGGNRKKAREIEARLAAGGAAVSR